MPQRFWAAILATAVGLVPTHVNKIVCRSRRLQLPVHQPIAAPQDEDVAALLQQRTLLRQQKAFAEADELLDRAKQFGAIVRDHANGTSTYTLRRRAVDAPSVLSLAKAARDYAVRGDLSDSDVAEYVAARAEEAREALAEPDAAPGRQASDAAFAFALAGCLDDELFKALLDRHASNRAKRRTVNDLQAEERLGACGLRGRDAFFAPRACQCTCPVATFLAHW